jgi:hypothetical protein
MLKSRMRDDSSEMPVQPAKTTWNKGGLAWHMQAKNCTGLAFMMCRLSRFTSVQYAGNQAEDLTWKT